MSETNTELLALEGEKFLPLALITFLKRKNKTLVNYIHSRKNIQNFQTSTGSYN